MPQMRADSSEPRQEAAAQSLATSSEVWCLKLAYDGTDFAGWQKQSEAALVETRIAGGHVVSMP